jgi:hypothetical protein
MCVEANTCGAEWALFRRFHLKIAYSAPQVFASFSYYFQIAANRLSDAVSGSTQIRKKTVNRFSYECWLRHALIPAISA